MVTPSLNRTSVGLFFGMDLSRPKRRECQMEQVHKLSSAFGPASVEEETAVQEVGRTKTGLLLSKSFFFFELCF